ncbi:MAG: protein translocase subunit SecF, partial [Candidatus Pacebacteria bacterium]|nr:protein translocase subunit SecF [Candidatus Paceibacterota bacterium]
LDGSGLSGYSLRETGKNGYALRAGNLTDIQRASLPELLSGGDAYRGTLTQQSEVGPTIGAELKNKSIVAMAVVLLCILLFIAFAFRHVSEPISSWTYGLIAIVTLIHDVIIPLGAYAVFGYFWGAQVDTLFVTALLTILGFSIHDTIVVFDRTRENLHINHEKGRREDFSETAGRSLSQTMVRSINTSVTVVFSLVMLYIFGPDSTKYFALTLLIGMVAGTYSSIFFATPLLVAWEKWRRNSK